MEPNAQEYDASRTLVIRSLITAAIGLAIVVIGLVNNSGWSIGLGALVLAASVMNAIVFGRRMQQN